MSMKLEIFLFWPNDLVPFQAEIIFPLIICLQGLVYSCEHTVVFSDFHLFAVAIECFFIFSNRFLLFHELWLHGNQLG